MRDEVRSTAEALARFQEAVSDMLAQPIKRAAKPPDDVKAPSLAYELKAVLPVGDKGSFASLLSWSDPLRPVNQRTRVNVRHADPHEQASAKVPRRA